MDCQKKIIILALIIYLSLAFVQGSDIHFSASQNEIHVNLTRQLTMTCSLNDTGSSSNNLIGRSLTHSAEDVEFLTSIVITREGNEHVASITEHYPAKALTDISNLEVKGQITGSSGFLELTWIQPTDAQVSEYSCEISGVTSLYHGLKYSRDLEISSTQPDFADLVGHFQTVYRELDSTKYELEQTKNELQRQIDESKAVENNLRNELVKKGHVETGMIDCGNSAQWPDQYVERPGEPNVGYTDKSLNKTVSFRSVYDKAPVVHISV